MAIKVTYVAAAVNRHSLAADISPSSVAAFGSSNLIALWDIADADDRGVSQTLPGHEGLVTCVRFISDDSFVSADDKGTIFCWSKRGSEWTSTTKVEKAHKRSISCVCVQDDWIVTGSSDATVKIWRLVRHDDDPDELAESQIISMKGRYPLSCCITYLPQSKVSVLAIGSTGTAVQIWARSDNQFISVAELPGHEDWVKGLAFLDPGTKGEPLTLASGSQDATVRLWTIEPMSKKYSALHADSDVSLSDDLLEKFEASLADVGDAEEGGRQISLKRHIITVKSEQGRSQQFSVTFDALLIGHEAGVTSLSWRPRSASNSTPTLLSTSTDSSLILWSPSSTETGSSSTEDGSNAIWINRQRFGDVGGQRLGGFVGGAWAKHGAEALAWGWAGGWRRWACSSSVGQAEELWRELGAITGHRGPVDGLDWSSNGEYLISAGSDQTTRIHAALPANSSSSRVWHEIARPQVHGYDMVGASFISPLKFASIGDEKVTRVFEAPRNFMQLVEALEISKFSEDELMRPISARVPPLGLSNKATAEEPFQSTNFGGSDVRRPFEGELASITLWPEIEKIFGHGYELISLCVSPSKKFMATACKATTPEHAVIRVYDTQTYRLVGQPLAGHSLTVTKIAFSHNDRYILSVSRDRSWRLFEAQEGGGYSPLASDKSHGRIIWDCAWADDDSFFVTASRDKTVRVWARIDAQWCAVAAIKSETAATAVSILPYLLKDRRWLAVGLENGEILIYSCSHTSATRWDTVYRITSRLAHVGQINQLAWRPSSDEPTLASCSEDGTVKIVIVQVTD